MIKKLNKAWGVFTHADVKNLDNEQTAYCDMIVVPMEEVESSEIGEVVTQFKTVTNENGVISLFESYREGGTSIPMDKWPFELTQEEIDELKPQPEPEPDPEV